MEKRAHDASRQGADARDFFWCAELEKRCSYSTYSKKVAKIVETLSANCRQAAMA